MMRATDALLAVGATLRLTRLVTTDDLGRWVLVGPANRWAINREGTTLTYEGGTPALDEDSGPRSKAVSGLECPFCVGAWIGYGVLAAYAVTGRSRRGRRAWRGVAAGLALNYLTGHVSSRLD